MADNDFVAFLVDETLKLQNSREFELSSLELKLKDYGLNYLRGEFIPQLQVLRFNTSFGIIDVPVNWSIFSIESSSEQNVILDNQNDIDHFFEIIKSSWGYPLEKLLMTHGDGFCYLVGLRPGEEVHIRDIINPQEWLKTA